jgi:hypothetical protein
LGLQERVSFYLCPAALTMDRKYLSNWIGHLQNIIGPFVILNVVQVTKLKNNKHFKLRGCKHQRMVQSSTPRTQRLSGNRLTRK